MNLYHTRTLVAVCFLTLGIVPLRAADLPPVGQKVLWQVESEGTGQGWTRVEDVQAQGGAYLESTGADAVRTMTVKVDHPTTLRVRPVWWRNGDQRPATRYPYPFEAQTGPEQLAPCGSSLFILAPTAARVGVIDAATEKLVRTIDVGGYLTDLACDPVAKRVYVTDAIGSRLVVIDAVKRSIVREVTVPAEPWGVAVGEGSIYVACRGPQCVVAVDAADPRITAKLELPAAPSGLDYNGGRLTVFYLPQTVGLTDLEPLPADQPNYGWPWHNGVRLNRTTVIERFHNGVIRVRENGKPDRELDVSEVTGTEPLGDPVPLCLRNRLTPDVVVATGGKAYFTAPNTGKIGVLDLKDYQLLQTIDLGGCPSDMVVGPDDDKLYVADALANVVHVIDLKTLEVTGKLPVPDLPVALEVVKQVEIQRPTNETPFNVRKLFVISRGKPALTVWDTTKDQFVKGIDLPAAPRRIAQVPVLNQGWWGPLPISRVEQRLTPKVAIELVPTILDAKLRPIDGPDSALAYSRRTAATMQVAEQAKKFAAYGQLVVRVDDQRLIDVTAATDPQLADPPPLRPSDTPGALTFSFDGGPEYDWMHGVWTAPDTQLYLVGDSDEFWRWNAPNFRLPPGTHELRIRAPGALARLDALEAWCDNQAEVQLSLHPEPRQVHNQVRLYGYAGVFYDREPVKFSVDLANNTNQTQSAKLFWRVLNYLDQPVAEGSRAVSMAAGKVQSEPLGFELADRGRHHLTLTVVTADGIQTHTAHFLRMPKLEHPRLMFRKDQLDQIKARIAEHPEFYQRYVEWLTRKLEAEGDATQLPDLFLPKTLDANELAKVAPEGDRQRYNWRNYEFGWRLVGTQFASSVLAPDNQLLKDKLKPVLAQSHVSGYCMYHHHGPYFPGAAAAVWDLAPDDVRESSPLNSFFAAKIGDMNTMPWTLAAIEEPLTPAKRAILFKLMTWLNNADQYFGSHVGERAGKWWQNPWTGCHCQNHGLLFSSLYFKNFFDEPRLYEKGMFRGFFTYMRYVDPLVDNRRLLPANRGPLGEPAHWLQAMLSRNPLEKSLYPFDGWFPQVSGPLSPENQAQQVDDLFDLKGLPLTGSTMAGVNHFVTGVSVPVATALDWYDPEAEVVQREELPETILCEQDGWVPMRSGWKGDVAEVTFVCGNRDHTSRARPAHFTINQSGEFLIGTPALFGDDGNNTCSWSNSVVVDSDWVNAWRTNLQHPRDGEYWVINRFSEPTFSYLSRDRSLIGFAPAEGGWGGGLDLHGHTETCYLREGRIIGYQTRPEFDYAAGDATNGWPLSKVANYTRQVVYIRPGTVVMYDRLRLGADGHAAQWQATTAEKAAIKGGRFTIQRNAATLDGQFLLPADAKLETPPPPGGFVWKGQQMLTATPANQAREQEYLVVMSASSATADSIAVLPRGSKGWQVCVSQPTGDLAKDAAGLDWFAPDYQPAGEWVPADAPFGYDADPKPQHATKIPDNDGQYYVRGEFNLETIPAGRLKLRVACDNAAMVWVNGTLADDDPAYHKPVGHELAYWNRDVELPRELLKLGRNVIAARIANEDNSSDAYFDLELAAVQEAASPVAAAKLVEVDGRVGVELPGEQGATRVMFDRQGSVGGSVRLAGADLVELPRGIDDTYRHWQSDPRYRDWATQQRFRFIVLPGDLDQ